MSKTKVVHDLPAGGRSIALWAGVIALANQGRAVNGLGSLDGRNNTLPMLYALPASDFHDVTTGCNQTTDIPGYCASRGWDAVTGLGTPDAARLVPDRHFRSLETSGKERLLFRRA